MLAFSPQPLSYGRMLLSGTATGLRARALTILLLGRLQAKLADLLTTASACCQPPLKSLTR